MWWHRPRPPFGRTALEMQNSSCVSARPRKTLAPAHGYVQGPCVAACCRVRDLIVNKMPRIVSRSEPIWRMNLDSVQCSGVNLRAIKKLVPDLK